MQVPLATRREPVGVQNGHQECYIFFNIKHNIFESMLHTPALWNFDISAIYPQGFHRVKFVVILPYFQKLIYIVRLLIARGNMIVKHDFYILGKITQLFLVAKCTNKSSVSTFLFCTS